MDYRPTLNLPQTEFPMKANLAQREPEMLGRWEEEGLYQAVQEATAGRPLYILHDGPPYANGHLHMGHALNKILKDIILKSKRMAGFHCPFVPGWDCHGLPIELNVDKELGPKKREIDKLAFREACRNYAGKWVAIQKDEFKRLGVLGDWPQPYLTIDYQYEAAIAREFNRFLLNGSVTRSRKPVHWCGSCTTALAEAEVEYADHESPSIYVKFPLAADLDELLASGSGREPVGADSAAAGRPLRSVAQKQAAASEAGRMPAECQSSAVIADHERQPAPGQSLVGRPLSVVIWTTTPWTLPANVAVAIHPDLEYAAVAVGDEVLIMAAGLVEEVASVCGLSDYTVLATIPAGKLLGLNCRHPFLERDSLIIAADYVILEAGTGCVHTAPGHGREDYLSGLKYHLPVLSPVDERGHFTEEAGPYAGMFILKANKQIIEDLRASGALLGEKRLVHSYPHCWRCKKPVMFRATEQWFISLEANDLRHRALAAIDTVHWIPRWGRERIQGMVAGRPDWCLSRQRAWGVPLTVISCRGCGAVVNDQMVVDRIVEFFSREGADAWFARPLTDFLGPDAACPKCGGREFVKEEDILDVWFDSGVSYAAVLEERPELAAPADLYLEGSDQHRGWFQSALLAAVGTRGTAPYRNVLTHGFVVDGQGKKMSKSLGNVIAPETIIKKYGAEILRLWAAAEDYRDDIKVSDAILGQLADAYRKIRNTLRFMLGNLYDFDPTIHRVADAELPELDRWALQQFELLKQCLLASYESFEFHQFYHALHNFCTVTLSALYLDIVKDRLYVMPPASLERRASQTVLYEISDGLLRLMAPVLSFLAAEAWEHLPADPTRPGQVFVAPFPQYRPERLADEALTRKWEKLLLVRSELTRALEIARRDKVIGHSLAAEVTLAASGEWAQFIAANWELLQTVTIVSAMRQEASLVDPDYRGTEIKELAVKIRPASGEKCERCWMHAEGIGESPAHPGVCRRCATVLTEIATP